jgi:hypothetical protein
MRPRRASCASSRASKTSLQLGDLPLRVATSTPRLETTNGTRYVKADFSHTTVVASPRITTFELVGIPNGTIRSWAHRTGVATVAAQNTRAATEAARLRWGECRLELAHRVGEQADEDALIAVLERTLPSGVLSICVIDVVRQHFNSLASMVAAQQANTPEWQAAEADLLRRCG